jgi:putative SOS response-associated peptidase YedK
MQTSRFRVHDDKIIGLAGLWDRWKKPDGSLLESFTIITTEPNELMRTIHRRMPVILHRHDKERWLDCSATPFDKVQRYSNRSRLI